ncbi:MAG: hypothetical protein K2X32_11820 [Phycisphaerales bacterium]|nr:hypothetical protein [Phycisphaerales bacterium]
MTPTVDGATQITIAVSNVSAVARAGLWLAVAWAVLVALVMGVIMIAGNRAENDQPWRNFALTFAVVLAAHVGYLLAPWAVGRAWWAWSFWLMVPPAALIAVVALMPIYGAIKWTRPDGGSGWVTIMQMGWMSLVGVALYAVPPAIVWFNRSSPE